MTKPLVLTHRFDDSDAMPKNFVAEMEQHFKLLPQDEYHKNPDKFNNDIVAIFPWFAQPPVKVLNYYSSFTLIVCVR